MEERIRLLKKQDDNNKKQHAQELQNTQITKEIAENIFQQTAHTHITQPIYSNDTANIIVQHIIKLVLKRTDKYIQASQSAKVHFINQTLKALINRENIVLTEQIYPPHDQSTLQCDKQPRTSSIFLQGTGQAKLYFEIKKKSIISSQMQPPPKLMNNSSHWSNKNIETLKKQSKNKVDEKQQNKKQAQEKQKKSTERFSNKQKMKKQVSIEDPKMNPNLISLDSNKQQEQNSDYFINYLRETKNANECKGKQRKQSITMSKNEKMIEGLSTSLIKSTKEYLYQTKSICSQNSKMVKRDRLQKSNAFALENFVCQASEQKIGYNAYSYDKVDQKMSCQSSLKKKQKQMVSNRKIKNRISTKDTVEQKQNICLPMIEEKKSPRRSSVKMLDQMTKWQSKQHLQNYKTKLGEYLNSGSILPSVIVRRATHGEEEKNRHLLDGVKQGMALGNQRCLEHDIE